MSYARSKAGLGRVACFARAFTPGLTLKFALLILALIVFAINAHAQQRDITEKLQGFDSYMEQILKDWNAPGIGVGIVSGDKLVFAKGYGYQALAESDENFV